MNAYSFPLNLGHRRRVWALNVDKRFPFPQFACFDSPPRHCDSEYEELLAIYAKIMLHAGKCS